MFRHGRLRTGSRTLHAGCALAPNRLDPHRLGAGIAIAILLSTALATPGCRWFAHQRHARGPLPPPAFAEPPDLDTVLSAVNANSRRVRQLQTEGASLSIEGVPATLQADLAIERPSRFRLTARLSGLTGRELDMGSNDDLFWFWIRRNPQPAVFFAAHDRFPNSPASRFLAVDPVWLIDAVGLAELDPAGRHQGPFPAGDGRLEVRSVLEKPDGLWTRVLIVDDRYAWVLEQHLYNPQGRLVASVYADQFEFDRDEEVSLPHDLRLQLGPGQPGQIALQLHVSSYAINQLMGDPAQLWAMPKYEEAPPVDITSPSFQPQMVAPAPQRLPAPLQWEQQWARPPGGRLWR